MRQLDPWKKFQIIMVWIFAGGAAAVITWLLLGTLTALGG